MNLVGGHWGLSETEKLAKIYTKTENPEEISTVVFGFSLFDIWVSVFINEKKCRLFGFSYSLAQFLRLFISPLSLRFGPFWVMSTGT